MNTSLPDVLASCRSVMTRASHVAIDADATARYGQAIIDCGSLPPPWDRDRHYCGPEPLMLAYVFVLDALNFCFWSEPGTPRWCIDSAGQRHNGYWALALALKQAFLRQVPLWDARYLSTLSEEDCAAVLRGTAPIPLFQERLAHLRELGQTLMSSFGGSFPAVVEAAQGDALALTRIIAGNFPSFADEAPYKGERVFFYKRAQILVSDLAGILGHEGWGAFRNLDRLTAFADYKLPQELRRAGILTYSRELADRVDGRILIPSGSEEEVEIRAATVVAVENLRDYAESRGKKITAVEIDWLLWYNSQRDPSGEKPYHLTRTVFY